MRKEKPKSSPEENTGKLFTEVEILKKWKLNTITPEEINDAFNNRKEKEVWHFYAEREFVENLLNQRFNYLIVMYSLFITAAASVDSQHNLKIILFLGASMTLLVSLIVYRAYVKLKILLNMLHSLDYHVLQIIHKEVDSMGIKALFSVVKLMGFWIPLLCFLSLLAGAILASLGIL